MYTKNISNFITHKVDWKEISFGLMTFKIIKKDKKTLEID